MLTESVLQENPKIELRFSRRGWFNASEASAHFDKSPSEWLEAKTTKGFFNAAANSWLRVGGVELAVVRRGVFWLHPSTQAAFVRWCRVELMKAMRYVSANQAGGAQ
jgi:hypothetical protein